MQCKNKLKIFDYKILFNKLSNVYLPYILNIDMKYGKKVKSI